jgi:hypothetical protein
MILIGDWYGDYTEDEIKEGIKRDFGIETNFTILEAETCEFPEVYRFLCQDEKGVFEVSGFYTTHPGFLEWDPLYKSA